MFYRLSLPGARRVLMDHIAFCNEKVPRWNPMSVVGQHTQQAGATPAEAMAFTLATAVQNAEDCIARGMDPDQFLPRFTFFFDISLSFFEEIAKFRAGRRIWARLARERLGAKKPRGLALQVPRPDLGRRPHAAAAAQQHRPGHGAGDGRHLRRPAVAAHRRLRRGLPMPSEAGARIAVATQNILREEAHLTDVIDPLGGSFYVESLTDAMEEKILAIMKTIDDAGGMYKAVESGLVQRMIGASALRFQHRSTAASRSIVGVNAYRADDDAAHAAGGRAARPGEDAGATSTPSPPGRRARSPAAVGRRARRPDPRRRGPEGERLRRRRRRRARRPEQRGDLRPPAPRPRLRPAARLRLTA